MKDAWIFDSTDEEDFYFQIFKSKYFIKQRFEIGAITI